jgi:hypothetical protein
MGEASRAAVVKTVEFQGESVRSARLEGRIYAVVRDMCQRLGLAYEMQLKSIQEDELYHGFTCWVNLHNPNKRGGGAALALDLEMVPLWLARIERAKVRADVQPKLLRYQRECAKALREFWSGRSIIEAFVLPQARTWELEFPWPFAREVMRLYGLTLLPGMHYPQAVCTFISRYIYRYFPEGVIEEINAQNQRSARGHRAHKTHQFLTEAAREQALREHKKQVWTLAAASADIKEFRRLFARSLKPAMTEQALHLPMTLRLDGSVQLPFDFPDGPERDA